MFSAAAFAAGNSSSALGELEVYAGPRVSLEVPAAQPALPRSSSFAFKPVPDPEAFSGFSCRDAYGNKGLNDIDLQELADTKVGYCGDFKGASLPKGFDLSGADLRGAEFVYASIAGVRMAKADLTGATFFALDAYWLDLTEAVMNGIWIENSTLGYGKLDRVQMKNASVRGVMLYGVRMSYANLDGIDMRGCAMYGDGATMEGTSMIGADLRNAYFTNYEAYGGSDNTTDFTGTVMRDAIYNEKSRFPFAADEAARRGMILRPGEY
ncbi:MAG: hypothetical protein CVU79_01225 [Elusimicrobia bacterium HGW-Elusimicrobia-3]|nr:MAG: hypothetical protein CVU79_01225 [Elusimicrobia bacterium HGW-Elusimicrobia-3]